MAAAAPATPPTEAPDALRDALALLQPNLSTLLVSKQIPYIVQACPGSIGPRRLRVPRGPGRPLGHPGRSPAGILQGLGIPKRGERL